MDILVYATLCNVPSFSIFEIDLSNRLLSKLALVEKMDDFRQILRAYVHIGSKNLTMKMPKGAILTSKCEFERALLSF